MRGKLKRKKMLINAIILSLVVYFIKASTWHGMIFEKPHLWLEKHLPEKLYKPTVGCPVCMTPWWGFILYMVAHFTDVVGFEDIRFQTIIFTLFTAAGISTVMLMLNKEYDVAIKRDKILKKEINQKGIK